VSADGKLDVRVEAPEPKVKILRLHGEFEGMAVLNAKEKLFAQVDGDADSNLLADFSAIRYIDSAGIGVLLEMAKKCSVKKIKFSLLNPSEPVRKVIQVTKVDKILNIMSSA
jgi:anti-anti-sigma factor